MSRLWKQLTAVKFAEDVVALAEEYDSEADFLQCSAQFGLDVQDKLVEYIELKFKDSTNVR